ncbi:hypothetical protein DM02DRAFT_611047 [Periconia macrospinosa]|uniref:Uncharacterized protein n=1 Tax=Periconia macrospinosa TaxID=97972 RepID=A0A2V1E463_9PLEO|nr:hypothetical protein DM02DRAFT_611047 [Periconia macrospinosa]
MRAYTIASLLSLAATSVSAVGNSIVINNSLEKIYVWSVGDAISKQFTVAPGTSWSEGLHRGQKVFGQAIKITKVENGVFSAAPVQILGYTLDADRLWFSLDAVFGEPFAGQKLTLSSAGSTGDIVWPAGKDIGDRVGAGKPDSDLVLTIDPQAGGAAPAPAPAPAAKAPATPSPAPAKPAAPKEEPPKEKEEEKDDEEEEEDDEDEDEE